MTLKRLSVRAAMVLFASLALSVLPAAAQDGIARAKSLYQSADYDEALAALDGLQGDAAADPDAATYRVFCLLALGRNDEARQNIGIIVRRDPRYQPSEAEASPRIRTVFQAERRRLLPQIFQERYDLAKKTFERKEYPSAVEQFKTLLALADDPALIGEESRSDFRVLISGFLDLAQAASATQAAPPPPTVVPAAPVPEAPAPVPAAAAATAPKPVRIYGANDTDVTPPVSISKKLPPWRPVGAASLWREYVGVLELVIDERGNVTAANIRQSVFPQFDPKLTQAARDWTFRPAMRQGQPVSYRFFMEVKLVP